MTQEHDIPKTRNEQLHQTRKNLALDLLDTLNPLLSHDISKTREERLGEQVDLLDIAFRRILAESEGSSLFNAAPSVRLDYYKLAFRAQNECRATARMLGLLTSNKTPGSDPSSTT